MADQRFPKTVRLLKPAEFQAVYQSPHFAADDVLVVKALPNDRGECRLGLAVSRKVGNAVVRNRWKRRLRESFRRRRHQWPVALDLVVRPRKGADGEGDRVDRSLDRLVRRISARMEKEPLR